MHETWDSADYAKEPPTYDGHHFWACAGIWDCGPQLREAIDRPPEDVELRMGPECFLNMVGPYCLHCKADYLPELIDQPCLPGPVLVELIKSARGK